MNDVEVAEIGRPTKYKGEYAEQAFKFALLGATDVQLAEFFDVHVDTIYEWKNVHPDFSEAVRAGKMKADAEVAHSLYHRAKGAEWTEEQAVKRKVSLHEEVVEIVEVRRAAPPDTNAASLWLRNRQSGLWSEKVINEHTGPNGGPMLTQDLTMTPEEAKAVSQAVDADC